MSSSEIYFFRKLIKPMRFVINNKELSIGVYDVIIIGGGPAGLTAGIYTSRAKLNSLLIENPAVSSQAVLTDKIENYPGFPEGINGFELIEKMRTQAINLGLKIISNAVKGIEIATAPSEPRNDAVGKLERSTFSVEVKNDTYKSSSLIIATGAIPKKLGIKGEEQLLGKGVSYCATCDGPLFKDKEVIVVGGGDAAVEEALFLTRFVRKVFLVHRRNQLRATKILQDRVLSNSKVEIVWNSQVVEILGNEKVEGAVISNVKTEKKKNISCDAVFIFIGTVPNTEFLKGIVKLDEQGYIITDENMQTSEEGIFACGDCCKKLLRQVVTACGDGATTAFAVYQFLEELKS